jgi:agmatine deiminase
MRDNLLRLAAAHDARGQKLEIIEVPEPSARLRHDGRRLEMSYINSCLANHGLVVPAFGDPCDDEVVRLMEQVFPDRRVVQVPALDIVEGGGGLHCITMQQPAGEALAQGRF